MTQGDFLLFPFFINKEKNGKALNWAKRASSVANSKNRPSSPSQPNLLLPPPPHLSGHFNFLVYISYLTNLSNQVMLGKIIIIIIESNTIRTITRIRFYLCTFVNTLSISANGYLSMSYSFLASVDIFQTYLYTQL